MKSRLTYSVREAADALGVSEWLLRRLIDRGEFPAIHLGGRVVIPKIAVQSMLEQAAS